MTELKRTPGTTPGWTIDGVAVTATAAQVNRSGGGNGVTIDSVAVAADELAIPVTHRQVLKTTGADAEALTLADGVDGQRLNITLAVDGNGAGTLTPTTASGFVTIVFADAGDTAELEFVEGLGWIIVGLSGVAGPPAITI